MMLLTGKTIECPNVKTNEKMLPGSDGAIDLTEYFGRIYYGKRKLIFEFALVMDNRDFPLFYSHISRLLHGKKMKIILDDDSEFYYFGRISVSKWKSEGKIGKIVIECDCDPYKYRIYETVRKFDVHTSLAQVLVNLNRPCVPVFVTDSAMNVIYASRTYYMNGAGTYTFNDFVLEEGNNVVCFNGEGNVTVKYREGSL